MEKILRQLGELLLGSIPTIILFWLLYGAYRVLVHRPLERVLAERHSRTQGAMEKAQADIAAAEARTAEYEQRLREARMAVYKAQEARREQALKARAVITAEARERAEAQVRQARVSLDQEKAAARDKLPAEAEKLAAEIVRTILMPTAMAPSSVAGGGE